VKKQHSGIITTREDKTKEKGDEKDKNAEVAAQKERQILLWEKSVRLRERERAN
jgi:hypothetical protein